MEDGLKGFTIATVFILVTSVCLLFFVLGYPSLNGTTSVLMENEKFNETANELAINLGNYQSSTNQYINSSTGDSPIVAGESLQLTSTVSVSRNILSRTGDSLKLLTSLAGNVLGLSGGQFALISGALLSLVGLVLLFGVIRVIRQGY
jgi:capsular polysaccharide biosynthesis protein